LLGCSKKAEPPPAAPEPVIAAVVVEGWEMWMGNDKVVAADDPTRYPGALERLTKVFESTDLGKLTPAGSQGMLITYADKPVVRAPMAAIGQLAGKLGTQKDYVGTKSVELVAGLRLAVAELGKAPAGKKVLIVIGDGAALDNDAARPELAKLKNELADKGIEAVAVVYKSPLSSQVTVIGELTAATKRTSSLDELEAETRRVLADLGKVAAPAQKTP
jgi:hypothetical protein